MTVPTPEGSPLQDLRPTARQFVLFVLSGGCSAVINIASRYLLNFVVVFEVAVFLAYLIGMLIAFILMRTFVFGASRRFVGVEVMRFVVVNIVSLILVWCTSVGLHRFLFPAIGFTWQADTVAHSIAMCLPIITSYIGHRYFTFARK